MSELAHYAHLVDQLAYKENRSATIVNLVGAINARDLAKVKLEGAAKTALINGLQHSNAKVRWWCLQLMDHIADASFIPAIVPILDDPIGKVRLHAVHALTCEACKPDKCGLELGRDIVVKLQAVAVSDPDERVRREAQSALAELGANFD